MTPELKVYDYSGLDITKTSVLPVHVEMGCGNNRRDMEGYKNIGVDLVPGDVVDHVCNLGFQRIPLDDNSTDFIQAIDLVEHIPKCVWMYGKRTLPVIHFMNECFRIIKNCGEFYLEIPFSDWAFNRDPTHVSHFGEDWYNYFKAADNIYYDQGLVECNFIVKESFIRAYKNPNDILCTRLVAQKD